MAKKKTGIDIISRRFSSFEKKALQECMNLKADDTVYDLGSGRSYFSIVLGFLGKRVIAIDKDFEKFSFWKIHLIKKLFGLSNITLIKKDITDMNYKDFTDNVAFVYSGRFLHYLSYNQATQLLKILHKKTKPGARLYFSISGIDTRLAEGYAAKGTTIEKRFTYIKKDLRKRFRIHQKICLYSQQEVRELFAQFFQINEVSQTAFGNINIIVTKK